MRIFSRCQDDWRERHSTQVELSRPDPVFINTRVNDIASAIASAINPHELPMIYLAGAIATSPDGEDWPFLDMASIRDLRDRHPRFAKWTNIVLIADRKLIAHDIRVIATEAIRSAIARLDP